MRRAKPVQGNPRGTDNEPAFLGPQVLAAGVPGHHPPRVLTVAGQVLLQPRILSPGTDRQVIAARDDRAIFRQQRNRGARGGAYRLRSSWGRSNAWRGAREQPRDTPLAGPMPADHRCESPDASSFLGAEKRTGHFSCRILLLLLEQQIRGQARRASADRVRSVRRGGSGTARSRRGRSSRRCSRQCRGAARSRRGAHASGAPGRPDASRSIRTRPAARLRRGS